MQQDANTTTTTSSAEAWEELFSEEYLQQQPAETTRANFERALQVFPLAHRLWMKYLDFERASADPTRIKDIFKRTLQSAYSVDLYVYYLAWLEQQHRAERFDAKRQVITDAYEDALSNVGNSIDALPLWQAYLAFLQQMPEEEAYDLTQKLIAMRKVYHRGVVQAMRGVDVLYQSLVQFEAKYSKDEQPQQLPQNKEYINASQVMKERETYWKHLTNNATLPARLSAQQVELWFKMLQYELGNPENVNPLQFKQRMRLVFRQAVAACWFHLEIWFAFYEFERETDDFQAGVAVLRLAQVALPASSVLHLTLADVLEANGLLQEAKQEYETMLDRHTSNGGESAALFIQYMRFGYRQFGLGAARDAFRRARAQADCGTQIYSSMAQLELLQGNKLVAKQVYELAMKRFPKDAALAHLFLDFMQTRVMDYSACKQAFERVCANFDEASLPQQQQQAQEDVLYGFYLAFHAFERESNRDVNEMLALERRMVKRFPQRAGKFELALKRYAPALSLQSEGLVLFAPEDAAADEYFIRQTAVGSTGANNAARHAGGGHNVKDMGKVPPFLHKLASIVPKKVQGGAAVVDVDFVIRSLTQGSLPLAPIASSWASGHHQGARDEQQAIAPSRKRQMGVDGAPIDAFKQRKEQRL